MSEVYMILLEGGGYIFPCGVFSDPMHALANAKIWLRQMPDPQHTLSVVKVPFNRSLEMGACGIPTGFIDLYRYTWDSTINRFKLEKINN